MAQRHTWRLVALVVGLGAASTLALLLLATSRGRAQATEKPDAELAEMRALVSALEGQLRATESTLKKLKERLAQREGGEQPLPNEEPKKVAEEGEDQTDLVEGVWRIVGIDGNADGDYKKPPYDEYKIMSAGHYLWVSFSPENGTVLRSGGGVYSIKNGKYTAHIECSNSKDLRALAGQEYKGTFKLDGKKWYHFGNVPNGAIFDELWERVH